MIALWSPVFIIDDLFGANYKAEVSLFRMKVVVGGSSTSAFGTGADVPIDQWDSIPGLREMAGPFKLAVYMHAANIMMMTFIASLQLARLSKCLDYNPALRYVSAAMGLVFLGLIITAHVMVTGAVASNYLALTIFLQGSSTAYGSWLYTYYSSAFVGWWIAAYCFCGIFLAFTIRTFAGSGCHNCCCNCCSCAYVDDDMSMYEPVSQQVI